MIPFFFNGRLARRRAKPICCGEFACLRRLHARQGRCNHFLPALRGSWRVLACVVLWSTFTVGRTGSNVLSLTVPSPIIHELVAQALPCVIIVFVSVGTRRPMFGPLVTMIFTLAHLQSWDCGGLQDGDYSGPSKKKSSDTDTGAFSTATEAAMGVGHADVFRACAATWPPGG